MKNIEAICSFRGNADRFEIYDENFKRLGPQLPPTLKVHIADASDDELYALNADSIRTHLSGPLNYYRDPSYFLRSWMHLLEGCESEYVLTIFEDQHMFGITEQLLADIVQMMDATQATVFNFDFHKVRRLDLAERVALLYNTTPDLALRCESTYATNDHLFGIINNDRAQQNYWYYTNNAVYRKSVLYQQLAFFSAMNPGRTGVHDSEMNHHMCPPHLRNTKIAVVLDSKIGYIDFDHKHIIGIRECPITIEEFAAIREGYTLVIE